MSLPWDYFSLDPEIVAAEPIEIEPEEKQEEGELSSAVTPSSSVATTSGGGSGNDDGHRRSPEPFDSEQVPPTLAPQIQPILWVANLIEPKEPRVAYLCRLYAFDVAHTLDRWSSGHGVKQFKTSILRRLEQDNESTLLRRKAKSDVYEVERVYHAYRGYIINSIIKSGGGFGFNDR